MARGDILIAEDDPILRNLYIKKFTLNAYEVRTAEDGEEAIRQIMAKPPDMLLCDLNMPKVNGMQVLQQFPRNRRTFPIIILTNYGDEKTRNTAVELGADDYFVKKDMTIKSLVEMVEKLMMFKQR
jgi:DNA-binding response OmpR family regulator